MNHTIFIGRHVDCRANSVSCMIKMSVTRLKYEFKPQKRLEFSEFNMWHFPGALCPPLFDWLLESTIY